MNIYQIFIIGLCILQNLVNTSSIPNGEVLQCYSCNSKTDKNCELFPIPSQLVSCPKTSKVEVKCISKLLKEGNTIRKCGIDQDCDGKDLCQACKTKGCNNINMKKIKEDNNVIGMWQDLPLSCLSCKGPKCLGKNKKCSNKYDKCVTIFDVKTTEIVERGCTSDIDVIKCQRNPDSCAECKSNNCNNANKYTEYIDCISCTSHNQQHCTFLSDTNYFTKKCHKHCMTALYPHETVEESYNLIRGCLNDKEVSDQKRCMNIDNNCRACDESNCNNFDYPNVRLSCYHCKNPEECKKPVAKPCDLYKHGSACYSLYDSGKIQSKGCTSDFNDDILEDWYFENKIHLCEKNNCNSLDQSPKPNKCILCNSKTNPNCAIDPVKVSSNSTNIATCSEIPNTFCYSRITPDGETDRGCWSSLNITERRGCFIQSGTCEPCSDSNCNDKIYPAKPINPKRVEYVLPTTFGFWQDLPISCHVCSGEQCQNAKKQKEEKCKENTDFCLTVIKNNQTGEILSKGCSSTTYKKYEPFCKSNPQLCMGCTSNLCNIGNSSSNYIDCIYCGPNDSKCLKIDPKIKYPLRKCLGECMTALYVHDITDVYEPTFDIIRSCGDDMENNNRCGNNEFCQSCTENSCNKNLFPEKRTKCYKCKTAESCKSPKSSLCDLYSLNEQCYYIYNNENISQMGCRSSLVNDLVEKLFDSNKIYLCNDNECNLLKNQPKEQECIMCDSKDNVDCAINPDSIKNVTKCGAPNNKCFSKIDKDGYTSRGCHNSLASEKKNCTKDSTKGCYSCNEPNCNVKLFPEERRKCFVCNSETDEKCEKEPQNEKICPLYKSDEICVTKYDNGKTQRGCGQELECISDDNKLCERCETNNCNKVDIKSRNSSALLVGNIFIIICAFILSLSYF